MPRASKKLKDIPSGGNVPYILPSDNEDLRTFCRRNKVDMMEQVVSSVEYALLHNLPMVEVFQFKKSHFVLTLPKEEFEANLDHIYSFYMESELYELCGRVVRLQTLLAKYANKKKKASGVGTLEQLFKRTEREIEKN